MELPAAWRAPGASPILLVKGELALALPESERIAAAFAAEWGVEPVRARSAGELAGRIDDLRTFSMFHPGKIVVAIATGALADKDVAQELLDDVRKSGAFRAGGELEGGARENALRLLQVLRLHDLDPASSTAAALLDALPDALFGGKKGGGAEAARAGLLPLLEAALEAGLAGLGESEASLLADLLRDGLPERHLLILVESAVAAAHPLVKALAKRGAIVDVGRLAAERGGEFSGLDRLFAELERETGVRIDRAARAELARRTLRPEDVRRGGEYGGVDADSIGRLAAELRKLAGLVNGRAIDRATVEANVEDRGQEEVWPILDAIGDGDAATALGAIARRLRGAEDPLVERLSLFALLANFARQVVQVSGAVRLTGVESGVSSYARFKERIAPPLKGALPGIAANPFARTKEFPLQRFYLAASRRTPDQLLTWPALLLETERRIKGDADDPDAALDLLVLALAKTGARSAAAARGGAAAGRGRPR